MKVTLPVDGKKNNQHHRKYLQEIDTEKKRLYFFEHSLYLCIDQDKGV